MVFYATLNGDVSIQTEAVRSYTKALETQRVDISGGRFQQRASQTLTSEEAICSTMMMCYLEMIMKTTPVAWMQHLDAAAAMIEAEDMEACQFGFMHQLFRTVRLGIVSFLQRSKAIVNEDVFVWALTATRRGSHRLHGEDVTYSQRNTG
jgi:hypothetical protein